VNEGVHTSLVILESLNINAVYFKDHKDQNLNSTDSDKCTLSSVICFFVGFFN
jgi:hypothetical protein